MSSLGLLIPGGILAVLVVIAVAQQGPEGVSEGLRSTGRLTWSVLPQLVIGFTMAGFLTMLLPEAAVGRWLSGSSGARGLLAGTVAGALTPGGPFTHFPILASLLARGAGVGPVSAYIAAWSLVGVHRLLIWEAPILGWRFVAVRVVPCVLLPPLIGWATQAIANLVCFEPTAPGGG